MIVESWTFVPEGAAVHVAWRTAVVADVHLGYEWARGAGGDQVPAHSLAETVAKLRKVLGRARIERLIVAGDLVESARPCRQTTRDVASLGRWLAGKGVELVPLQGNHDPPTRPPRAETIEVDGWTIGHGHRPIAAERVMIGHHHPVLKGDGIVAPCFLVGPRRIVLPAFSANAAGLDVTSPAWPDDLRADAPRCLAGLGDELLDFGPLDELVVKLRGDLSQGTLLRTSSHQSDGRGPQ
jgi:putative SbcD/Mre11-related phosphoesterase